MTDQELTSYFQAYGSVVYCKVKKDEYGNSKKFGMVQFDTEDAVNAVLNDYESHNIQGKWIDVKPYGSADQNGKGKGKGKGKHYGGMASEPASGGFSGGSNPMF